MSENADERFFDLLLKTLNYSIEFANAPGYASLRFMDLFTSLVDSQALLLRETRHREFYQRVRERIRTRLPSQAQDERSKLQSDLTQMFIDEWRKPVS